MKRPGTRQSYKRLLDNIRARIPNVALRTTFIVGFPGETAADFAELESFIDEMEFDHVGVFTYSREEGTPAAAMAHPVPAEVMAERAALVQESQDRLAWERQAALLGSIHEVLIDGPSEDPAYEWEGRTAAQAPEIDGVVYLRDRRLTPGRRVPVEIVEVDGYDLVGTLARR